MNPPESTIDEAGKQARRPLKEFLVLALLTNLAVAQPLYSKLGAQAEFFVAHGLQAGGLILLTVMLSIALPGLIAALPTLFTFIDYRLGKGLFSVLLTALAFLVFTPFAALMGLAGFPALGAALLAAAMLAVGYAKSGTLRLFLAWFSAGILIFPLAFLLFSRASSIVLPAASEAGSGEITGTRNNIVFVVLDEFPLVSLLTPKLDIDRERYPNFGRLADMSHWFTGASSGAEGTVIAVPSALTGLPPGDVQGHLPLLSNFPDNLFSRFQHSHAINATETATHLCPRQVCNTSTVSPKHASLSGDLWIVWRHIVTPKPWSDRLPSLSNAWSGFTQDRITEIPVDHPPGLEKALAIAAWSRQMDWNRRIRMFDEFTNGIKKSNRPQLHYLHALLPHAPWNHLPDGRRYAFGETSLASGLYQDAESMWRWPAENWPVQQAWQRHLLQIQFLDSLLGDLLDRLISEGLLEETLLVIMGDHGAAFVPGEPRREVTRKTLTDITAVPLFVKVPGQLRGVRHGGDARLQDVFPTLLDSLGQPFDGLSLLSEEPRHSRGPIQIFGRAGLAQSYSFDEHMSHLRSRAAVKATLFSAGNQDGLYAVGPETMLHGTAVSDSETTITTGQVEFAGRNLYRNVDPSAAFIPRLVRGEIQGRDPGSSQAVAISVNGIVRATTWAEGGAFTALLGPDALQAGMNRLEAFLIDDSGARIALARLQQEAVASFTLRDSDSHLLIEASDGSEFSVVPGNAGRVASVPAAGESLYYLAGNLNPGLGEVTQVLAFIGSALAAVGEAGFETHTFSLVVPARAATPERSIRVFALLEAEHEAVELDYAEPCLDAWAFTPPARAHGIDCEQQTASPLKQTESGWHAKLNFGDAAVSGLLGRGWGTRGSNIRWSLGKSAIINIPLPPDTGRLEFRASVKPYLAPPGLAEQEVWLLANGRPVGTWTLTEKKFTNIEWALEPDVLALSPDMLELRFITPNARAPRALGTGADLRELGLAVNEMQITGN